MANIPMSIHLNDQQHAFNSGRDKHGHITNGTIWSTYKDNIKNSGIMAFYERFKNTPMICEIKDESRAELYTIISAKLHG
jgi:endonuclease IV